MDELKNQQATDFGVVLYEKSNAKHALDAPTGKIGAKGWALRIYIILIGVALFGWFLYSVISSASNPEIGAVQAIAEHLMTFFVLMVAELILMLTAFNGWGKFTRAAFKRGLARQRGMEGVKNRELAAELAVVDANKANENAIRIYRDLVVVVNDGVETLIHFAELQRVKCVKQPQGYQLTFELYGEEPVVAKVKLPIADLPIVKKHFDNFEYEASTREKGYLKKKFPMLAFVFIPVLIGVALIIVHSLVLPDMPLIFGAMFLAIGLLLVVAQFNDVPVINHGIIPICFGLLFTALPIAIGLTVADLVEEITVASLLTPFTPVHAILSVFFGFGPMMIIAGVAGLSDCFKL